MKSVKDIGSSAAAVIPDALKARSGIHSHHREYGFRVDKSYAVKSGKTAACATAECRATIHRMCDASEDKHVSQTP